MFIASNSMLSTLHSPAASLYGIRFNLMNVHIVTTPTAKSSIPPSSPQQSSHRSGPGLREGHQLIKRKHFISAPIDLCRKTTHSKDTFNGVMHDVLALRGRVNILTSQLPMWAWPTAIGVQKRQDMLGCQNVEEFERHYNGN